MKKLLISLVLMSQAAFALADGKTDCNAAAGSYRTGTVVGSPKFARATQTLKGVGLSHTHIRVQTDQDGQIYDVAMDNVYANDYVKNSSSIPKSLAAIKLGDKVEMCGQLYSSGYGIHWVHDNCNVTPDRAHPDGFVKKVVGGVEGSNLESSQAYCYLWN
ncbi:hypothetical protein LPB67_03990 [Undibacterium sp. Jales W-56]|uniref:hypothetical protein n=1 Tax=Undibacterium sp. Jales W-56 TaxID=2897325 RepID=UPI0021D1B3B7|nr:hypothetical protein [Undibacterium sp. Jales W-56]MCU6432936.1 hypothetical protein [Undibacterium sp. Jales W-56]